MESIRDCFVTGSWAAADDAKTRLQQDGWLSAIVDIHVLQ